MEKDVTNPEFAHEYGGVGPVEQRQAIFHKLGTGAAMSAVAIETSPTRVRYGQ